MSRLEAGKDGAVAIVTDAGGRRRKIAECARCGLVKRIKGHGLCSACASAVTRNGTLEEYSRTKAQRLAEFERHRESMNVTRAAAATGVSRCVGFRYEKELKERRITGDGGCHCECHGEWFFTHCPNGCGCKPSLPEGRTREDVS